jgi:excisionase family DNA binding protein
MDTQPTAPAPLLLTSQQAAAALGISQRTLWALGHSGHLTPIKIGRSVRYSYAALAAWVARRQAEAAEQAAAGQEAAG